MLCLNAAGRQLTQEQPSIDFPGCTFLQDSAVAANSDYSTLFAGLDLLGLNTTLSTLTTPYTLFAPTNEAFQEYNEGSNITNEEGASSPFLLAGYQLLIVPEAILVSTT